MFRTHRVGFFGACPLVESAPCGCATILEDLHRTHHVGIVLLHAGSTRQSDCARARNISADFCEESLTEQCERPQPFFFFARSPGVPCGAFFSPKKSDLIEGHLQNVCDHLNMPSPREPHLRAGEATDSRHERHERRCTQTGHSRKAAQGAFPTVSQIALCLCGMVWSPWPFVLC